MFEPSPKARAVLSPGMVYAVAGPEGWLYFGQVTSDKRIGFFRYRTRTLDAWAEVLSKPVMAEVNVSYSSIGRALRSGAWKRLQSASLHLELRHPRAQVQWPVGASTVLVWPGGGGAPYATAPDDPEIQDLEIMATWDAEAHIPERLAADFGDPVEEPLLGSVARTRRGKELMARRFPDAPGHALPPDWVLTGAALRP